MRGRKPARFELKRKYKVALQQLLRKGDTPLRVARRAQILLYRAQAQQPVKGLGEVVAQDATTIWRVCALPPGRFGSRLVRCAALRPSARFFPNASARRLKTWRVRWVSRPPS